ncbi:hypothetical protein G3T36_18025 [Diaminobutyricibacter tongyongensis]|uniref:Uncharacterized protein n=1 Tax=Leifsonia tongyongensis TaxID=1268043 RepID=A0A6L9Y3B6_9MICO|nr:hypothetical protein [Diaminobutyricibacter tongyongensis]NEN07758.1 hypothetical protein [Diaminobutyricibacter tongyongensis]
MTKPTQEEIDAFVEECLELARRIRYCLSADADDRDDDSAFEEPTIDEMERAFLYPVDELEDAIVAWWNETGQSDRTYLGTIEEIRERVQTRGWQPHVHPKWMWNNRPHWFDTFR